MKALILNSGMGTRMGALTSEHPKCMTQLTEGETILSRQLRQLAEYGVTHVVMTTGFFDGILTEYCASLGLPLNFTFVKNPRYRDTNYIYSIYCAREQLKNSDVVMLHGDLVFEDRVLERAVISEHSVMAVCPEEALPQKDFKAIVENEKITKIGIEFFENAVAAQPLYKLTAEDVNTWLSAIEEFCESGNTGVYAENAFNTVSHKCQVFPLDTEGAVCCEIDTPEDRDTVCQRLEAIKNRIVYMCFSNDMLHSGHISIIKKAAKLGRLTVGVMSDEAVAGYKRFPLMPFEERRSLVQNITGVNGVVEQKTLSYRDVLRALKPDYVVHGDDWKTGFQKNVRQEVLEVLAEYGGRLVEFPYSKSESIERIEARSRAHLSIPDVRRGRLKRLLTMKSLVTVIEAHSGITGLIAEKTVSYKDGVAHQFDAMWVSSLCDSTAKGKPDIELVDMSSRMRTIDDIMDVTTKPIILDGDTGGLTEHFVYNVKTLERMGVSAVIIEDKTGLKKNSLFGTEVEQTQADIAEFCEKISAGKKAQKTKDFMIIARIESLILERGMEDALERAVAFVGAGADGIMIHSRKKSPDEIFEFVERFREKDKATPVVVVPTSFNQVTEEEFARRGVNIVIYANQLTRSGFPAMQKAALTILENHRAKEADEMCMSIKEILTLIPDDN